MPRRRRRNIATFIFTLIFGAALVLFTKTQLGYLSREGQREQRRQLPITETTTSRRLPLEEMSLDDFMQEVNDEAINAKHAQVENDYDPVVSQPLITLFTVMQDNPSLLQRNINTMLNWDALYPGMIPVLVLPYTKLNMALARLVRTTTRHWKILLTTDLISELPVLRGMFKVVEDKTNSTPFIGYADSDTVFDKSILGTLRSLLDKEDYLDGKTVLITGHSSELGRRQLASPACLRCVTNMSGRTTLSKCVDYLFMMRQYGFPWHNLPRLLVGRDYFADILVRHALMNNVKIIDATLTLFAVRQVTSCRQVESSTVLENFAFRTWPAQVRCPPVYANSCLPLDVNK